MELVCLRSCFCYNGSLAVVDSSSFSDSDDVSSSAAVKNERPLVSFSEFHSDSGEFFLTNLWLFFHVTITKSKDQSNPSFL